MIPETQKTRAQAQTFNYNAYHPTFESESFVVLKKNCTDQVGGGFFFTKGRICIVSECGLSFFYINDKDKPQGLVEHCDHCLIDAIVKPSEYEQGGYYGDPNEEPVFSGVIRAEDLRKAIATDFA